MDVTKMSIEEIEREQLQCRNDLKFARTLKRKPLDIMARFNLLVRELNSRGEQ